MNRNYRAVGIVLRRVDWGEADRVLTLYTQHKGKLRILAKGIKKLSSRKSGSLEPFSLVLVVIAQGKNLGIVTEVEVLESYNDWRKNLLKVAVAYYFCELVERLTPEEQSNEKVFELLLENLRLIGHKDVKKQVRCFEENLLDELGFGVPDKWRQKSGSLRFYIETITERKINSPEMLHGLFKKN